MLGLGVSPDTSRVEGYLSPDLNIDERVLRPPTGSSRRSRFRDEVSWSPRVESKGSVLQSNCVESSLVGHLIKF